MCPWGRWVTRARTHPRNRSIGRRGSGINSSSVPRQRSPSRGLLGEIAPDHVIGPLLVAGDELNVVGVAQALPEQLVEDGKCVYIHGSRLRAWLAAQPELLDPARVQEIATAI